MPVTKQYYTELIEGDYRPNETDFMTLEGQELLKIELIYYTFIHIIPAPIIMST